MAHAGGRPRLPENLRRTETCSFRVTAAEREELRAAFADANEGGYRFYGAESDLWRSVLLDNARQRRR